MIFMITSFQINGQPYRSLNLDVNTYNIEIHIFFFYRAHDNIGQSRYQHWYWYCWCLNWYPLHYAVVALNYWREESVKWTSFVIMYLCQAPGNGLKYSEANSALLIPRNSRQSKSRGEMAAKTLDVAVWLCIFQMNNNVFPSEFLLQMFRVAVAVKTILIIMCAILGFGFAMTICTDSTAHLLFMFLW